MNGKTPERERDELSRRALMRKNRRAPPERGRNPLPNPDAYPPVCTQGLHTASLAKSKARAAVRP